MQVQWKGKAILSSSEKTCAIAESGAGIFLPPKDKQICKICARAVPWPLAALAAGGGGPSFTPHLSPPAAPFWITMAGSRCLSAEIISWEAVQQNGARTLCVNGGDAIPHQPPPW